MPDHTPTARKSVKTLRVYVCVRTTTRCERSWTLLQKMKPQIGVWLYTRKLFHAPLVRPEDEQKIKTKFSRKPSQSPHDVDVAGRTKSTTFIFIWGKESCILCHPHHRARIHPHGHVLKVSRVNPYRSARNRKRCPVVSV